MTGVQTCALPISRLIAPPYNKNFSVNVVFPASGCEIIAKVRLFSISFLISADIYPPRIMLLHVLLCVYLFQYMAGKSLCQGGYVPLLNRRKNISCATASSPDELLLSSKRNLFYVNYQNSKKPSGTRTGQLFRFEFLSQEICKSFIMLPFCNPLF